MPMIYDDDASGCLTIKGRAGMQYERDDGEIYSINSEMVVSDEYHIAVHASADVLANGGRVVTGPEKEEVISRVIALCEKGGIRIRLF